MRVGTVGKYVIIARGAPQGDRWAASFKLRLQEMAFGTTSDVGGESISEETFATREEAENHAFAQGERAVYNLMRINPRPAPV